MRKNKTSDLYEFFKLYHWKWILFTKSGLERTRNIRKNKLRICINQLQKFYANFTVVFGDYPTKIVEKDLVEDFDEKIDMDIFDE